MKLAESEGEVLTDMLLKLSFFQNFLKILKLYHDIYVQVTHVYNSLKPKRNWSVGNYIT